MELEVNICLQQPARHRVLVSAKATPVRHC
jgi:hypothetical protein